MRSTVYFLESLNLRSNHVGEINSTTFQRFKRLDYLYLDDTNLTIVGPDAFKHLWSLKHLDLSNNNLKHVDPLLFSTLPVDIVLRNIQVENILETIKLLPSSVISLDISSNYIGKLKAEPFDRLPNLKDLYLRNTSLFEIETEAFQLFNKMVWLGLAHNSFKQINFSASTSEYSVEWLFLEENEVDLNLDTITPERFPMLRYLRLSTDRFSCEYLNSFSRRMKRVEIASSSNEPCYNLTDNIF